MLEAVLEAIAFAIVVVVVLVIIVYAMVKSWVFRASILVVAIIVLAVAIIPPAGAETRQVKAELVGFDLAQGVFILETKEGNLEGFFLGKGEYQIGDRYIIKYADGEDPEARKEEEDMNVVLIVATVAVLTALFATSNLAD